VGKPEGKTPFAGLKCTQDGIKMDLIIREIGLVGGGVERYYFSQDRDQYGLL
jgi:hypothetical protein